MAVYYEVLPKKDPKDFSNKVSFLIENRAQLEQREFLLDIFTFSSKPVIVLPEDVAGHEMIRISSDTLFDIDVFLQNLIVAVPKTGSKVISFPKEEIPTLQSQDQIITTRVKEECGKYKMGDIVITPWGDRFTVNKLIKYKRITDHPFYKELTESQKNEISTQFFEVLTLNKLIPGKRVIAGDSFYLYGLGFKSIADAQLPLNDTNGKQPGSVILFKLSESGDQAIYHPQDVFKLTDGMIENYQGVPTETTVGRYLFNYLILVKPFGMLFPYRNELISIGKIDDMVANALLNKVIGRPQYDKYMAYGFFIGQFSELCVPGMSRKSMGTDPSIRAMRDKLLKENKDKLTDPTVLADIESKLIDMDKAWIKGDSSEPFYAVTAGKSYKEHRKKMFITMGLAQAFKKNSTEYTFIPNSLAEGWDPKFIPDISNEVRRGSYDRGKSTAKGGEQTKFILRIFQNLRITESDCGVSTGLKLTLTEKNYKDYLKRYIIENGKTVLLTDDLIQKYLGKEIIIRGPMYCKTKTGLCYTCAGEYFRQLNSTAIGMLALDIGSRFTSISMKSMHFSGISTTRINTLTPFFF